MVTVKYPEGPDQYGELVEGKLRPGQGLNAFPPERSEYLDFSGPLGKGAETVTGLMFQLPKWGYERWRVEEWIEVTPVFQQYYQLTIQQKQQMEQQIKSGLASASQAVSDLELVTHDFRKYREFMDFFTMIEKGSWMIKEGKKESGESLKNRGEQTLKSIFIDQVDIHTGEGVALRSIASRWPTIIVDFMKLKDVDIDYKKIGKDYEVSEAEGVILSTKNKLYIEWRDRLFKQTVMERYDTLLKLMQARKKSFDEYKTMLRPLMARYKMLNEGLAEKDPRHAMRKLSFWRPESQAISSDFVKIWAWKPIAFAEKYKISRQNLLDEINAAHAGFTAEEIEVLKKSKEEGGGGFKNGIIKALPVEPSIDSVFRMIAKNVADEYKVELTAVDWQAARQMMIDRFETSLKATSSYEPWVWSPYFVFLELPIMRSVMRSPSGAEMENIFCEDFRTACQTQNIVLGHYLELVARDRQIDDYVVQMLGESGAKGESIEQLKKELEWKTEEETKDESEKKKSMFGKKIGDAKGQAKAVRVGLGKTLEIFGVESGFFRGEGTYELVFRDRVPKNFITEVAAAYDAVVNYFKSAFQVPGSRFL
jgi:hypothetical protein